jgi:dienelactone hydrolase
MSRPLRRAGVLALALLLPAATSGATARAAGPAPGSPAFVQRDLQNMADAYGRITAPGGQLQNPGYVPELVADGNESELAHLAEQAATPTRPRLTPGLVIPGWNQGNPLRHGWDGARGLRTEVHFTNRYGALLHGDVFAPLPGARDPYTGRRLKGPFPGVVITTGSIQGSEKMYWWLAEDLAERGYVVLTYDVQGQGASETFPHQTGQDVPFCNPFAAPEQDEQTPCPGVPFQQDANFTKGTEDALSFFLSTPREPYANTGAGTAQVNAFNPLWKLFDRSPDTHTVTPGRTTRVAIVGHSLGAAAVSKVQGRDDRVEAVVALDKLQGGEGVTPTVPALAVQSEYGFAVTPYFMSGSSIAPSPTSPTAAPDPRREQKTGFDAWRQAGVDTMLVVPRASTHLEYSDIPLVLPASRYGQDLTSVYVQAWLDRYLKHRRAPLLATSFRYLEPVGVGTWRAVQLQRDDHLSFYHCSGYRLRAPGTGEVVTSTDIGGVGGC